MYSICTQATWQALGLAEVQRGLFWDVLHSLFLEGRPTWAECYASKQLLELGA